ncbi:Uncharacterized protein FKW44_025367 [Caligus rogercresseyi]|uniref:Fucosyltransferase n=1 Tax=Caligus rogercresseyi TaxID=217165 RepID=A0A7T8GL86_CALRO|nr:Uncharacterized protein FKW44_025366 [Caligus rogercresseyi]QQP31687.1 Uncharacterized protein FKW44_025367 [Caligus rogercresseyi]
MIIPEASIVTHVFLFYRNCYLTSDKFPQTQLSKYSGVIYHARDICERGHDPGILNLRHQIKGPIMFFLLESPVHDCALDFWRFNHVFNWTISYRRNSDFFLPYNGFEAKTKMGNIRSVGHINLKRKLVFWLVKNMGSPGGRDTYIQELEKHIRVDRWGGGTKHHCPPETEGRGCKAQLAQRYKFYLAFENSLCKDYVTEKFFDILKFDVVPVVYGLSNYSAFAPPHSFIDARDFSSPKSLGEYLTYLDNNDEEYLKYFKWKEEYHLMGFQAISGKVLCDMCERINHLDDLRRPAYSSEEMESWWRGTKDNQICQSPKGVFPEIF